MSKFKAKVTDDEWFEVSLMPFDITNTTSDNYKDNPYLTAVLAAYVSTYICGISSDHLEYKSGTPGIITNIARYHLYYHMSRFISDPSKLKRYLTKSTVSSLIRHRPYKEIWKDAFD